jgi:hypothetical protein
MFFRFNPNQKIRDGENKETKERKKLKRNKGKKRLSSVTSAEVELSEEKKTD